MKNVYYSLNKKKVIIRGIYNQKSKKLSYNGYAFYILKQPSFILGWELRIRMSIWTVFSNTLRIMWINTYKKILRRRGLMHIANSILAKSFS